MGEFESLQGRFDYRVLCVRPSPSGLQVRSIPYVAKNKTLEGMLLGRPWLVSRVSVRAEQQKNKSLSRHESRQKPRTESPYIDMGFLLATHLRRILEP